MFITSILSRYICKQFLMNFLMLTCLLLGIIYLFDTVELMRRAAKYDNTNLFLVIKMSLLKLPEVGQLLIPFSVLFSGIYSFWSLTRTNELVVYRVSGLSAWQFLLPIFAMAMLIGVVVTTIVNPISAVLITKYEQLETEYLNKKNSLITISKTGIWLRQSEPLGHSLLYSASFDPKEWALNDVIVFYFDKEGDLTSRIDARNAQLNDGFWLLNDAYIYKGDPESESVIQYKVYTDLTSKDIEDSFASPETLPFWKMPSFIKTLEETGFPATRLKIHYQSLLAKPLFFGSMILLAAAVSLRPPRKGGTATMVGIGVFIGFFIFFMENILTAFGISNKIPIYLAAWSPACISLLLGTAVILYLEDG